MLLTSLYKLARNSSNKQIFRPLLQCQAPPPPSPGNLNFSVFIKSAILDSARRNALVAHIRKRRAIKRRVSNSATRSPPPRHHIYTKNYSGFSAGLTVAARIKPGVYMS
jgi:hypothetical protein